MEWNTKVLKEIQIDHINQAVLTFIIQKSNYHYQIILFKAAIIYPLWQFRFDSPHWYTGFDIIRTENS